MITFLVSGLWHGAGMHFIIWGGIHGLYQVIGDITSKLRDSVKRFLHITPQGLADRTPDASTSLILASPLADTIERREIEGLIRSNYENSLIYKHFPDYFEKLVYYPAEDFSDGVHPSVDRASMNEMIRTMQKNFDCMYDLTLE